MMRKLSVTSCVMTLVLVAPPSVQAETISDLQFLRCQVQSAVDKITFVRAWLDKVENNSVVFVHRNGDKVDSPVQLQWKKTAICPISEQTDKNSEKRG